MTIDTNPFLGIDHHAVIINDLERSLHFYRDILGLEVDSSRPELSFEGVWFKVGHQAIHCMRLNNPDPVDGRPEHGGRDRHICLMITNINLLIDRLEQFYVTYTRSQSGRAAIFFCDPDGNAIEIKEVKI